MKDSFDINKIYKKFDGNFRKITRYLKKEYPEELEKKGKRTNKEFYYNLLYGEGEKCKVCNKKTVFSDEDFKYRKYCSIKCANNSKERVLKIKVTKEQKYGKDYASKLSVKGNIKKEEKYGKDYALLSSKKGIKTKIQRYGEDYGKKIAEKSHNTMKERYGENYGYTFANKAQKTIKKKYGEAYRKIMNKKAIKTKIEKYGESYGKKIAEKAHNTMKERYGEDYGYLFLTKAHNTMKEKYGDDYRQIVSAKSGRTRKKNNQNKYREKIKDLVLLNDTLDQQFESYQEGKLFIYDLWTFTCKKCKKEFQDYLNYNGMPRCFRCYPQSISKEEGKIIDFIQEKKKETIWQNDRTIINPLELDILIQDYNIAIEYNGILRHSIGKSKYAQFNNYKFENKIKHKHLIKTELCEEKNIQLLHIQDNEWLDTTKREIWKSIISGKLHRNSRLYARKTNIDRNIPSGEVNSFLEENHLQGKLGCKIAIGLRNKENNELVSLMTFGKSRYGKKYDWELLRFASKKNLSVVGGASKIFKDFVKNYLQRNEKIVSYADRKFSNGHLYKKLGFSFLHNTLPNYYYFKEGTFILKSRINYQKHKLEKKLERFDPQLTETINMYNNGFRKIYDSGNRVYVYSIT